MPKNPNSWAIATSQTKKSHPECRGAGKFGSGSHCDKIRKHIAEAIGEHPAKKARGK